MTTKTFLILPCVIALTACSGIGSNGNDTSFERVGVQTCTTASQTAVGTAADPVRCGPQSQPIDQ